MQYAESKKVLVWRKVHVMPMGGGVLATDRCGNMARGSRFSGSICMEISANKHTPRQGVRQAECKNRKQNCNEHFLSKLKYLSPLFLFATVWVSFPFF